MAGSYNISVKDVPAIEVNHHKTHKIWVFAYDPKDMRDQVNIKRIQWDEKNKQFSGYQRTINDKHVSTILEYLKTGRAIVPNVISIALRDKVDNKEPVFTTPDPPNRRIRSGTLSLPFVYTDAKCENGLKDDEDSLAWVIDGQHRLEALTKFAYTPGTFPVFFSAIKTSDIRWQTELYARINMTLPVKKEDMERILSIIEHRISVALEFSQLSAKVRERMLLDSKCPFADMIRR